MSSKPRAKRVRTVFPLLFVMIRSYNNKVFQFKAKSLANTLQKFSCVWGSHTWKNCSVVESVIRAKDSSHRQVLNSRPEKLVPDAWPLCHSETLVCKYDDNLVRSVTAGFPLDESSGLVQYSGCPQFFGFQDQFWKSWDIPQTGLEGENN